MTEDQLKEIEARHRRATPGPWVHDLGYGEANLLIDGELKASTNSHAKFGAMSDYDIEFISRAREDVPHLIEEVRRLRNVVERAMWPADEHGNLCPWCMELDRHAADCMAFTLEGELK